MNTNEEWRAPQILTEQQLIFDEPGRIVQHVKPDGSDGPQVDSTAYHFRVTRSSPGGYRLYVRHGAGDESWFIGHEANTIRALTRLDSNDRFHVLRTMMHTIHAAERTAREATAKTYAQAFTDGRLKKRKIRGQATARVWIETKEQTSC